MSIIPAATPLVRLRAAESESLMNDPTVLVISVESPDTDTESRRREMTIPLGRATKRIATTVLGTIVSTIHADRGTESRRPIR